MSSLHHESETSFRPHFTGFKESPSYLRNKDGDAEIDIFSADKYFSGRMDEDAARKAVTRRRSQDKKSDREGDIKPRIQLQPQTPSVYSESSWNSQSALLTRQRNQTRSMIKAKAPKKKFLAKLGCKCACSDQNSVDVEDHHADDHKQNTKPVNIKVQSPQQKQQEEERKSMEIFGSSQENGSFRSFSLETRMKTLAWDAIPKVEEMEIQGPITAESIKDNESEASSDLFEIECLSCSANPVILPRNNTVDCGRDSISCASPTTCYAPSEASFEWSVVTASAAEFSEEQASFSRKMLPPRLRKPTTPIKEIPKTRFAGILSGCKSQKAVRVAEDVYATTRVTRSESYRNVMPFQIDSTKNVGFASKYRKDLLYIQ